ncbi:MAG: DUF4364 family protein [Oscillospiraceae bacterium]|jgi:hypothetical protein
MPRHGFIHDKKDIMILILYVAARLPGLIPEDTLMEQVMCDGGFDYFDYSDALAQLREEKFIVRDLEGRYSLTKKGADSEKELGSMLPYSVRMKVEKNLIAVAKEMERNALIGADISARGDGLYNVHLSLDDGLGNILSMDMMVPTREASKRIADNFRKNAEKIYNKLLDLMCEEE